MQQLAAVLAFVLLISAPSAVFANHRDRDSDDRDGGGSRIDRSDLDDDVVEDLPLPILFGLVYANIRNDFGDPRDGGARTHEGQDLFAPEGTPIVSPTEAIVIRTGTGEIPGKYIYTANPGGETFRYMHLKNIADLDSGDTVKAGTYLGTVGDTGNAKGTPYHLHFEVRDEDNKAVPPYERLVGSFTLKQKVSFLPSVFKDRSDDDEYAEFLVGTFTATLKEALVAGYELPEPVVDALRDRGIISPKEALEKLTTLIQALPTSVSVGVTTGSEGAAVRLLQFYLIFATEGVARDALKTAGPTGYFGPVTASALMAYQTKAGIPSTGVFDAVTKATMVKQKSITLNLK